jgi:hypothetical protein
MDRSPPLLDLKNAKVEVIFVSRTKSGAADGNAFLPWEHWNSAFVPI